MKKRILGFLMLITLLFSLSSCNIFTKEYDDSNATVVKVSTSLSKAVDKVYDSCVGIYCTDSSMSTASIGSGVIFKEDNGTYYVITNYHVVESYVGSDSAKFYVYVGNTSTRYRASLTAALNSQKDLAVLTINPGRTLKTVSISKDYHPIVSVGENVFAIGCPISLDYFNSVCSGVVSKTEYTATNNNGDLKVIQNTCPINPGNSGGGLFNMAGELIGLNFKKTTYVMEGSSKTLVDGLNYAISLNEIITHLIKYNLI